MIGNLCASCLRAQYARFAEISLNFRVGAENQQVKRVTKLSALELVPTILWDEARVRQS